MSLENPKQLEALNKKFSKSFYDQKALLKKLLSGKEQRCIHCKQPLFFNELNKNTARVSCKKGCTDIELDISE